MHACGCICIHIHVYTDASTVTQMRVPVDVHNRANAAAAHLDSPRFVHMLLVNVTQCTPLLHASAAAYIQKRVKNLQDTPHTRITTFTKHQTSVSLHFTEGEKKNKVVKEGNK